MVATTKAELGTHQEMLELGQKSIQVCLSWQPGVVCCHGNQVWCVCHGNQV